MVNRTRQSVFLLLLSIAGMATGMAPRPVPPPVPMELVRAIQDTETGALAIEWVVPNVEKVGPLDRLELLILNEKGEVVFGAMQNLSDRCNPVPPEAFGVVLDPTSDERSIDNVASAGIQAQWDQESAGGTLLKQSVSGVHNGTLGIAFWIAPGDWKPNTYLIAVRAIRKNSQPEPWQNLTTLAVTGSQSAAAAPAERCQVQPLFTSRGGGDPAGFIHTVTLIRYEEQPQDEGVVIQRWAGDTSGKTKTVEIDRRELKLSDYPDSLIPLEPGLYQLKHNSVLGMPPSGFYGESRFFSIRPGQKSLEVSVVLNAAI